MSLYQTTMVSLSVLQNIQQTETNEKLGALLNTQQLAQQAAQRASNAKEQLYRANQLFDQLTEAPSDAPTCYLLTLQFQQWAKDNCPTGTAAFDALSDKQYFTKTVQRVELLRQKAEAALTESDRNAVQTLQLYKVILASMQMAVAWLSVRAKMRGGRLVWTGFMWSPIWALLAIVGLAVTLNTHLTFSGYLGIMVTLALPLIYRNNKAKELSSIVEPFGGKVTTQTRTKDVDALIGRLCCLSSSSWLIVLPTGVWPRYFDQFTARAKEEAARLKIPEELVFS